MLRHDLGDAVVTDHPPVAQPPATLQAPSVQSDDVIAASAPREVAQREPQEPTKSAAKKVSAAAAVARLGI